MTATLAFSFFLIALGLLRSRYWYLGGAVSKEAGNQPAPLPAGVKPLMVASSRRLIALAGPLNILGVFLRFGYYFLYSAFTGTVSLTWHEVRDLFTSSGGAVIFAPYLADQLENVFSSFGAVEAAPQTVVQPANRSRRLR